MNEGLGLKVLFEGREVGTLTQKGGPIYFTYSLEWLKEGFSISPRSLPLEKKVFQAKGLYYEGLFGVFADSLPDAWGIRLAVKELAKRGIDYGNLPALEKLRYVGKDGLGGLSYQPSFRLEEQKEEDYEKIAMAALAFSDEGKTLDLDILFEKGSSSGGARPKAHLSLEDGEYIVKFRERKDPLFLGKMEYEYNLAAKECGVLVPECHLLPSSHFEGYFASKRFDRLKDGRRVHVLSLGGLLEAPHYLANLDYVTFLQATAFITNSSQEVLKAFRLACFNIFSGNKDDHSKNFSFFYDEEKQAYLLSPAYDLTFTPFQKEHEMTCCGNGNPNEEDLLLLAKKMNIPEKKAKTIIQQIKDVVSKQLTKWMNPKLYS